MAWTRAASASRDGVVRADSSLTAASKVSPLSRSRTVTLLPGFTAQTITSREAWTAIDPRCPEAKPPAGGKPTGGWLSRLNGQIRELLPLMTDIPRRGRFGPKRLATGTTAGRSSYEAVLRAINRRKLLPFLMD